MTRLILPILAALLVHAWFPGLALLCDPAARPGVSACGSGGGLEGGLVPSSPSVAAPRACCATSKPAAPVAAAPAKTCCGETASATPAHACGRADTACTDGACLQTCRACARDRQDRQPRPGHDRPTLPKLASAFPVKTLTWPAPPASLAPNAPRRDFTPLCSDPSPNARLAVLCLWTT